MSYFAIVLVILMWVVVFVSLGVAIGGKLSWLEFLYIFSYVKLTVTLIKYVPQVSSGLSAVTGLVVVYRSYIHVPNCYYIVVLMHT